MLFPPHLFYNQSLPHYQISYPYKQEDIFNVDVFKNGGSPAYNHPRGRSYKEPHPAKPKWNGWQDIFFF